MGKHELIEAWGPGRPGQGRILLVASVAGYPDWVVEFGAVITDAGPVSAHLRVVPRTGGDGWTPVGISQKPHKVPAGGIPARLMRAINVGELLDLARQRARAGGESLSKFLDDYKFDTDDPIGSYLTALAAESQALSTTRPRTGRKGNGIDHYLTWAIRYADKTRAGVRNPHAALAVEHPGFSTNYIRDTVTDARRRYQLLTDAGQGRAGGELTAKALALIAKRQGTKQGDDNG